MWGKIASCFTLLTQITRLKVVNSEIKSEDQSSYLERYSPKGPCHLDESSMSHTLAQKQSSYTGQEGVNERPRNSVKAPIAIASVFSKLKLMWKKTGCDNSAAKLQKSTWRFLGWASSHPLCRYVDERPHRYVTRALHTDIYRKNAASQLEHPDQAPETSKSFRLVGACWLWTSTSLWMSLQMPLIMASLIFVF